MCRYISVGLISPGSRSYREVFGEKDSGPQPIPGLTEPSGSAYEDEERLARAGSVQFLPFVPSVCHSTNLGTSFGEGVGVRGKFLANSGTCVAHYSIELGMLGGKFPAIPAKGLRSVILQSECALEFGLVVIRRHLRENIDEKWVGRDRGCELSNGPYFSCLSSPNS